MKFEISPHLRTYVYIYCITILFLFLLNEQNLEHPDFLEVSQPDLDIGKVGCAFAFQELILKPV